MATCAKCGAEIPAGQEVSLRGKGKNAPTVTVCLNCEYDITKALRAETADPNVPNALALGLVAALVSALAWYALVVVAKYQLGIVAIAIGWVVSQAVIFGAGRKRGTVLQGISIVLVIFAMAFGEYLIDRHFLIQELAQEGITDIPWLIPFDLMLDLVIFSIKSDPVTLLFWAIAIFEAYKLPQARKLQRSGPQEGVPGPILYP